MASADLRAELECSVCLNISTDPVTLKCGHNFCRDCIGRVLDTQEGSGGYSCPECREKLQERSALQRNIKLRNIVENFLSAQPDQKSGILCTYCIHTPVPAVKSCLMCEASLCDNHLRVHSKAPEHVLCDLTTSLENMKCSVHKELLKYYCTEDSACICVSCSLAGEHRGHQVETLDEASEKKKKKLRNVLQKLMTEREETEKRVRELEIKKDELSRKMRHIEELCNMTDPLTVLQESDTGDLCDTEDGDDEDRARHDRLLHDGGGLDVTGISHTLHTGISDIMSGVIVQKGPSTHIYPHSSRKKKVHITAEPSRPRTQPTPTIHVYPHSSTKDKDHIESELSRPHTQPSSTIQHSHRQAGRPNIGAVQQTLGVTDISLDVRTAGNRLLLPDDRKSATWSYKNHNRPETAERFRGPQVLSSRSFSSGRHYWEVDVRRSKSWIVGMCYPSIERGGDQSEIGDNKKSWGLERSHIQYSVIHDRKEIPLPGNVSSNRVRIVLDYEAGRISFYDLCDPIRLLHTFTTTFTEPLHAGVYVGRGCIKISGGNQM